MTDPQLNIRGAEIFGSIERRDSEEKSPSLGHKNKTVVAGREAFENFLLDQGGDRKNSREGMVEWVGVKMRGKRGLQKYFFHHEKSPKMC